MDNIKYDQMAQYLVECGLLRCVGASRDVDNPENAYQLTKEGKIAAEILMLFHKIMAATQ